MSNSVLFLKVSAGNSMRQFPERLRILNDVRLVNSLPPKMIKKNNYLNKSKTNIYKIDTCNMLCQNIRFIE